MGLFLLGLIQGNDLNRSRCHITHLLTTCSLREQSNQKHRNKKYNRTHKAFNDAIGQGALFCNILKALNK
jgi:hypothetical protein